MSGPAFRYENSKNFRVKGVKNLIKESIIDGEKGLSFVVTKKEGDNKFHRIFVKEISKDKFEVKEKIDDKETTKEIDMSEVKKMLKANKDLGFVKDYVDNERGSYKGGSRKMKGGDGEGDITLDQCGGAKKSSKSASKKASKSSKKMKGGADDTNPEHPAEGQKGGAKSAKKSSKKVSKKVSKSSKKMKGGADDTNPEHPTEGQKGGAKSAKKSSKKSSKSSKKMKGGDESTKSVSTSI